MYILRGLRPEYDSNIRILEIQKKISTNDIRFALKLEEHMIEMKKVEGRSFKDYELIRKVKERSRNDICCFKCGMKGHMAVKCSRNQRCFNCQSYNHVIANCRKLKQNMSSMGRERADGFQREGQRKYMGQDLRRKEVTMRANDEAVMKVNGTPTKMGLRLASKNYARRMGECANERYLWLLDSESTSHMTEMSLCVMTCVRIKGR